MNTSDFYFDLPDGFIAQEPLAKRDQSKLMLIDKESGAIEHKKFYQIIDYLDAGDCLVLNDSRVLPARIYGKRETGAKVEFLLLTERTKDEWECLVKPGKKAKIGDKFDFDGLLTAEVIGIIEDGIRIVKFYYQGEFYAHLDQIGAMPLPPYITLSLEDQERYQTVYNRERGSAAAPTAGLHFTDELLEEIKAKGVNIAYLTLHVGLGTFRPVKVDDVENHQMHSEFYQLDEKNAAIIRQTKEKGGRIISVGTTSTRTLESIAKKHGEIVADSDWTDIFIYPPYQFKAIDALITNFHLPESTLLMLVSAFYNKDAMLKAYQNAIENNYRFFSFGDCMLIK